MARKWVNVYRLGCGRVTNGVAVASRDNSVAIADTWLLIGRFSYVSKLGVSVRLFTKD